MLGPTSGGVVALKTGRGRYQVQTRFKPSRSEFSVIFSETRKYGLGSLRKTPMEDPPHGLRSHKRTIGLTHKTNQPTFSCWKVFHNVCEMHGLSFLFSLLFIVLQSTTEIHYSIACCIKNDSTKQSLNENHSFKSKTFRMYL